MASYTATGVSASRSSRRCTILVMRDGTTSGPGGGEPGQLVEQAAVRVGQAQGVGQGFHDLR